MNEDEELARKLLSQAARGETPDDLACLLGTVEKEHARNGRATGMFFVPGASGPTDDENMACDKEVCLPDMCTGRDSHAPRKVQHASWG